MTTQEILEAARAARSALALADGQTRTQALWGLSLIHISEPTRRS